MGGRPRVFGFERRVVGWWRAMRSGATAGLACRWLGTRPCLVEEGVRGLTPAGAHAGLGVGGGALVRVHWLPLCVRPLFRSRTRPSSQISDESNPTLLRNYIHDNKSAGIISFNHGRGIARHNDITSNGKGGVQVRSRASPELVCNRIFAERSFGVWVYEHGLGRFEDNDIINNAWSGFQVRGGPSQPIPPHPTTSHPVISHPPLHPIPPQPTQPQLQPIPRHPTPSRHIPPTRSISSHPTQLTTPSHTIPPA